MSGWDGTEAELDVDIPEVSRLIDALYGDVPVAAPVGSILWQAHSELPSGYLPCDGSAYSEAAYPALFAKIGYLYGNPGGGFFNVPDYGARVTVGEDAANGYPIGDTGGEEAHTLTIAEMPAHGHNLFRQTTSGTTATVLRGATAGTNVPLADTGGDQPHNNMQPYIVQYAFIKT